MVGRAVNETWLAEKSSNMEATCTTRPAVAFIWLHYIERPAIPGL